jgi:hypothetical protein
MAARREKTRTPGIYKRGSRYFFQYEVEGRQRWESARTLDEARRAKAARHCRGVLSSRRSGVRFPPGASLESPVLGRSLWGRGRMGLGGFVPWVPLVGTKQRLGSGSAWRLCPGLGGQHRFDALADVEPAATDLDTRQHAAPRPIFDRAGGRVQQAGDLAGRHHVVGREACRRPAAVIQGAWLIHLVVMHSRGRSHIDQISKTNRQKQRPSTAFVLREGTLTARARRCDGQPGRVGRDVDLVESDTPGGVAHAG